MFTLMGYVNKLTDKAEISFICAEFYQARICQLISSHAQQQWCSCHTRVFICKLGCRFSFCTLQTMNWSVKSVISEQPALTCVLILPMVVRKIKSLLLVWKVIHFSSELNFFLLNWSSEFSSRSTFPSWPIQIFYVNQLYSNVKCT